MLAGKLLQPVDGDEHVVVAERAAVAPTLVRLAWRDGPGERPRLGDRLGDRLWDLRADLPVERAGDTAWSGIARVHARAAGLCGAQPWRATATHCWQLGFGGSAHCHWPLQRGSCASAASAYNAAMEWRPGHRCQDANRQAGTRRFFHGFFHAG